MNLPEFQGNTRITGQIDQLKKSGRMCPKRRLMPDNWANGQVNQWLYEKLFLMTLIATFSIGNNPVMIGDILLSRTGTDSPHSQTPIYDDVSTIMPTEWLRIVSGLHRKICLINSGLVVGWTGSLIYSANFITKLKSLCLNIGRQSESTFAKHLEQSKQALSEYAEKEYISPNDLTIIGWFKNENNSSLMFEWNWTEFKVFPDTNVLARGSGAHDFYNIVSENPSIFQNVSGSVPVECVKLISFLLGMELTTGGTIKTLYGGGYDIVIDTNEGFKYLSDIQYIPIFIENFQNEIVNVPIPPQIYFKYFYVDGNLAIARKVFILGKDKIEKDEVTISLIGQFGDSREKLESLDISKYYSFDSDIVSFIFIADVSDKGYDCYARVYSNGKEVISFDGESFLFSKKVYQECVVDWKKQLSAKYGWK